MRRLALALLLLAAVGLGGLPERTVAACAAVEPSCCASAKSASCPCGPGPSCCEAPVERPEPEKAPPAPGAPDGRATLVPLFLEATPAATPASSILASPVVDAPGFSRSGAKIRRHLELSILCD